MTICLRILFALAYICKYIDHVGNKCIPYGMLLTNLSSYIV